MKQVCSVSATLLQSGGILSAWNTRVHLPEDREEVFEYVRSLFLT